MGNKYNIDTVVSAKKFELATGEKLATSADLDKKPNTIVLDAFDFNDRDLSFASSVVNLKKYSTGENFTDVEDFYNYVGYSEGITLDCYNQRLHVKDQEVWLSFHTSINQGQFLITDSYRGGMTFYWGTVLNAVDMSNFFNDYNVKDTILIKNLDGTPNRWIYDLIYGTSIGLATLGVKGNFYTANEVDGKLLEKQDILTVLTSETRSGLILDSQNQIGIDHDIISTNAYVDQQITNRCLTKVIPFGSTGDFLYGVNNAGTTPKFPTYYVSINTVNDSIVKRTNKGRIKSTDPQDTDDVVTLNYFDAVLSTMATKTYVDNAVATLTKTITLTQAEFDALTEYEDNTNYQIID